MGPQVPSPNMKTKFRFMSLKKPLEYGIYSLKSVLMFCNKFSGFLLRVGCSFLLHPTFNTSLESHLQKVLSCRHLCRTWDWGLGTPCEVKAPNFHALENWDCTDRPRVNWKWELGPCVNQSLKYQLSHPLWDNSRSDSMAKFVCEVLPTVGPHALSARMDVSGMRGIRVTNKSYGKFNTFRIEILEHPTHSPKAHL